MQNSEDNNPTAQAIRKAYGELEHAYTAESIIPFSSDRKWGAMTLTNLGTVYLGGPRNAPQRKSSSGIGSPSPWITGLGS